MAIELDFNEITDYADMPSLYFIIKVAGTWAGQSEDIELKYSNYTVKDGVLEVWTIPGEGSSIEIYETEEETKFPKTVIRLDSVWILLLRLRNTPAGIEYLSRIVLICSCRQCCLKVLATLRTIIRHMVFMEKSFSSKNSKCIM